jgi:hypothetical protein
MPKQKYKNQIKTLPQTGQERLDEVTFYLLIKEIQRTYGDNMFTQGVIENTAMLANCKISNINQAIEHMDTMIFRPKPYEIALLNSVRNVNMRALVRSSNTANKTMYNALEHHENKPEDVRRTLEQHLYNDIRNFNIVYRELFKTGSELV